MEELLSKDSPETFDRLNLQKWNKPVSLKNMTNSYLQVESFKYPRRSR